MRLDRRFGNYFNGTLAYTFQQAKNTGSDPFTYIDFGSRIVNQVWRRQLSRRRRRILPTDYSRPHTLALAARAHLPERLAAGHRSVGTDPAERRRVRHLPLHQRHAVHRLRQATATRTCSRGDNCAARLPRAAQQLAAPRRSRSSIPGSPRASAWAGWT